MSAPPRSDDAGAASDLAEHVETTVETLAQFHHEHYRGASPLQNAIDRVTETAGRPSIAFAAIALIFVVVGGAASGVLDSKPVLEIVELASTLAALGLALLILVTQRRENQLAEGREKLTLELALLTDQRGAKIIALLEELRRDHPDVADRVDVESDEMSTPTDAKAVMDAIVERAPADGRQAERSE